MDRERKVLTVSFIRLDDPAARKNWSIAFAAIIIKNVSIEALHAMAAEGEDKFVKYCHRFVDRGFGFTAVDYNRMFKIITKAAKMNPHTAQDYVNRIVSNSVH